VVQGLALPGPCVPARHLRAGAGGCRRGRTARGGMPGSRRSPMRRAGRAPGGRPRRGWWRRVVTAYLPLGAATVAGLPRVANAPPRVKGYSPSFSRRTGDADGARNVKLFLISKLKLPKKTILILIIILLQSASV